MRLFLPLGVVLLFSLPLRAEPTEDWPARLKDADAGVRRLAALAVGKRKMASAVPALVELLRDSEASVRDAAANALARIGPPAVPALAGVLKGDDESARLAALRALARLNAASRKACAKDMLPALTAALKDKSVDVRIHAAFALGRLGAEGRPARQSLFEAARDTANLGAVLRPHLPSSVTEAAVAAALAIDPDCGPALAKAALPDLTAALRSKDSAVVQAAAYALAKLGPNARSAVPALREAQNKAHGFAESAIAAAQKAIGGEGLQPLADLLKDQKAPLEKRLRALEDLGWTRTPDDRVVSILTEALGDPQPRIRAAAVGAIGLIGPRAKTATPALLELLGDAKVAEAASSIRLGTENVLVDALAHMGAAAAPGLADVLADRKHKPLARFQAVQALAQMGRRARTALPTLEAGMKDDLLPIAIESAHAYARAGGEVAKAMPILHEGLTHKSVFVLRITAHAVERLGRRADRAVPDLSALLTHEDREVRIAAAHALSVMGPAAKPAVPAMARLLKSEDGRQRLQIAMALEKLGADAGAALPALIEQLPSLDKMSPHPVLTTIGKLGPEAKTAVPALMKRLSDGDDLFADDVLLVLGDIGSAAKAAVPRLIAGLDNKSPYSRARAARALGGIGPEARKAVPALRKRLEDEQDSVRAWAAYALARITGDIKPHVALLVEIWEDDSDDEQAFSNSTRFDVAQVFERLGADAHFACDTLLKAVRDEHLPIGTHACVARALGSLRDDADRIVPALIAMLNRKADAPLRDTWRARAAEALGLLGPKAKAAIPPLRRLIDDEDEEVAEAAATALAKIEAR